MGLRAFFIFNAIYSRRSIRDFKPGKKIEGWKIEKLLMAAMAAPSACNIQPWDFIVIDDKDIISRIKKNIAAYGDYNTPLITVITGNNKNIPWKGHGTVDCSLAMIGNRMHWGI
jgi:nitroreductase